MPPQTVTTGVAELDALTGGLPRGALSELAGPISSGRTGVMLAALAAATQRQEVCALVDASDSFDPASAHAEGVDLQRLLWVRCSEPVSVPKSYAESGRPQRKALSRLDQVLKVTDLLLQSGGFGMLVVDMGDIPAESTRRVPLTSWFRFRRAVEQTDTVLLLLDQEPCARTCASLTLQLRRVAIGTADAVISNASHNVRRLVISYAPASVPANNPVSHASLLREMRSQAEVGRSWARKSVQSVYAGFDLSARHSFR